MTHHAEEQLTQDQDVRASRENETSLIDLLSVLIRFRRFIVGGTLFVGIGAVVMLYIVRPVLIPNASDGIGYAAHIDMVVERVPADLSDMIAFDPASAVRAMLTEPHTVGVAYRPVASAAEQQLPMGRYLTHVRTAVIGQRITHSWDQTARILSISARASTPEAARTLVGSIVDTLTKALYAQTVAVTQSAEKTLRSALEMSQAELARAVLLAVSPAGGGGDQPDLELVAAMDARLENALADLTKTHISLELLSAIRGDMAAFFHPLTDVTVYDVQLGTRRSTTLVIVVVTAFFAFVFLAFVLQYVRTIRADPLEMEKLRAAWHRK